MNRLGHLLSILCLMAGVTAYAQQPDTVKKFTHFTNMQFEAKWSGGFLWAHSPTVTYLQKRHTMAFEATVCKPVSGKNHWHTFYPDAIVGATFQHYYLGNTAVIGTGNGVYGFCRFNILGHKGAHLRFSLGSGMVYLSKTFDKVENHKNLAIGSHLDCLVNFQLLYEQRITKHLFLEAGLSLTHFSNGAFKTPNLGLNLPAVTLGAAYRIHPTATPTLYAKNEFEHCKGLIFSVIATMGRKEIYPPNARGYATMGLMVNITKPIGIKSGLTLTLDLFNDRSIAAIMKRDNPGIDLPYTKTFRPGIAFGYDLWLGKLAFIFQAGVYPYTYYKGDGRIYSRLGWRYRLPYGITANLTLKTHFAKADNIEFGLGYTLFNKHRVLRLL